MKKSKHARMDELTFWKKILLEDLLCIILIVILILVLIFILPTRSMNQIEGAIVESNVGWKVFKIILVAFKIYSVEIITAIMVIVLVLIINRKCISQKYGGFLVTSDYYADISYRSYVVASFITGRKRVDAKTIPIWLIASIYSLRGKEFISLGEISEMTMPVRIKEVFTPGKQDTVNFAISSTYEIKSKNLSDELKQYDTIFISDYKKGIDRHTNEDLINIIKEQKSIALSKYKNVNLLLYVPPKVIARLMRDVFDRTLPENEQFEVIKIYSSKAEDGFTFKKGHKF